MRNLAFFRGAFFAVTTISRLPFVTWETAATPAQNFSVTPNTAPVFSLTQSRVNDLSAYLGLAALSLFMAVSQLSVCMCLS